MALFFVIAEPSYQCIHTEGRRSNACVFLKLGFPKSTSYATTDRKEHSGTEKESFTCPAETKLV